jgi:hypothetical protein
MNLVVKLPNKLSDRILAFPFLHALNRFYQERDEEVQNGEDKASLKLHLICLSEDIDSLNLLPFHAFYHPIESEDLESIFTVHRGCANLKFTNEINLFISTTDSFVDASIGKNIKAKNKIGFATGKNGWFLNKKVERPSNVHKSEEIFELLKPITGLLPKIPYVQARKMDPLYPDWSECPYVVLDLDHVEGELNDIWKELFELSSGKTFILMSSTLDHFEQELRIEGWIKNLPTKNTYKFFPYKSNIELSKLISYTKCFVTADEDLMHLSSYCGALTFYVGKSESFEVAGPKYTRGEVKYFNLLSPGDSDGYSLVFDSVLELIDTKQPEE